MKFVDNRGITDPTINLAIEQHLLFDAPDEDYLLFYVNEPSIIIGKNQNTAAEINAAYVEENGIHIVRRLSGGGAVYHDLGNLNFSFITRDDGESFHNYRKVTQPVVEALRKLGVEAELTGRNDIQVGARKISGNAQFSGRGRIVTHGTLMLNSDLERVTQALRVDPDKIASKGIQSIRSRVANISEFLREPLTMDAFKRTLLDSIFGGGRVPEYELTDADWSTIKRISEERYRSWDWNYGRSPSGDVSRSKRLAVGKVDVRLSIQKGKIASAVIFGDFFGKKDVAEVERSLIGIPYEPQAVATALDRLDLADYFGPIERDELLSLFV